jgi:deazaflavin-dependent oxidoreductase (nitroreductase family)
MAYRKPNAFVRKVFNPLAMRFGIGGTKVLKVAGRRTGNPQTVPVVPIDHGGARYLVSPRGETDWVKNLRAAGAGELDSKRFSATEVPVGERGPMLDEYKRVAGSAVKSHFEALPDAADHPVFRLEGGA